MPWPSPQEYNEAIQNPRYAFSDPDLQKGVPELTGLGLPRPITGNFASVYRVRCAGRDWAVRCFWREYADMQTRYAAISRHLERAHLPYTVPFEYLPRGIFVRGQWYPILKMQWVSGELLNSYVVNHLNDPQELVELAERWLRMNEALERASIAHGDLQHGNVLVVNGELKLVDYDAMYVPALNGKVSHEVGHQHYQHPGRSGMHFAPETDRFSAWSIYLSLLACSLDPALWTTFGAGDERLLLSRGDYITPESSAVLSALSRHGDERVRLTSESLLRSLTAGPLVVPRLRAATTPNTFSRQLRPGASKPPHSLRAGSASRAPSPPGSGPEWLQDYLAAVPHAPAPQFTTTTRVPRITIVGSLLLFLFLTVTSTAAIAAEAVIGLSLLLVNVALILIFYRLDGSVAELHRLLRLQRAELRVLARIEQRVHSAERKRQRAQDSHNRVRAQCADRRAALGAREATELSAIAQNSGRDLSALDEADRSLQAAEQHELAAALTAIQARHTRECLRRASLRSAVLPGVGWAERARLWALGMRCAADVTSERLAGIRGHGDVVINTMVAWRLEIEDYAGRTMPLTLPNELVAPVHARYARDRGRVQTRRRAAEQQRSRAIRDTRALYERGYAEIDNAWDAEQSRFAAADAAADAAVHEARVPEAAHHERIAEILAEVDAYHDVKLTTFVRHVLWP